MPKGLLTMPLMTTSLRLKTKLIFRSRLAITILGLLATYVAVPQMHEARAAAGFDLNDYNGKVVLLDFWASWCGPCRQSFPWMNDMHEKYSDDGLIVVAVNLDNDPSAANRFLADYPASFRVHFDDDKSLARKYEVVAMPSSFLIGRDGEVVERHLGFKVMRQNEYEAAIQAALKAER